MVIRSKGELGLPQAGLRESIDVFARQLARVLRVFEIDGRPFPPAIFVWQLLIRRAAATSV
jgi:hypothetical protein